MASKNAKHRFELWLGKGLDAGERSSGSPKADGQLRASRRLGGRQNGAGRVGHEVPHARSSVEDLVLPFVQFHVEIPDPAMPVLAAFE
jgi:hypothetical protein